MKPRLQLRLPENHQSHRGNIHQNTALPPLDHTNPQNQTMKLLKTNAKINFITSTNIASFAEKKFVTTNARGFSIGGQTEPPVQLKENLDSVEQIAEAKKRAQTESQHEKTTKRGHQELQPSLIPQFFAVS